MQIEQAYEQRSLGVTVFRAFFVTLLLSGVATLYLLMHVCTVSAVYGGFSTLLVSAFAFVAALVIYTPANRQLRGVYGVSTLSIFKHQRSVVVERKRDERDLFDRLEKDLDF